VGCTNRKAGASIEEEIQKKFGSENKVLSVHEINDNYVLVESQYTGSANRFTVYNLETGKMDELPTSTRFTTLEKIVDENCIILCDTGKSSESAIGNFPSTIKFNRDGDNGFVGVEEDKYFSLDYSVESGSKNNSNLSSVKISDAGIEFYFSPVDGDKTFYADWTDIPETKVSYDKQLNQLCFKIKTTTIGSDVQKSAEVNNQFISSYNIVINNDEALFNINLKSSVKSYTAKTCRLSDGQPYLSIGFSAQ
jgi:hypothetical protein